MTNTETHTSLPEEDHLVIHEFNRNLLQCETKKDFNKFILNSLLPWLNCDSAVCGLMDINHWMNFTSKPDGSDRSKVMNCIGIPKSEYEVVLKLAPYYKALLNLIVTTSRPVLVTDLDIPRDTVAREVGQFFSDHPQYDRNKLKHGKILAAAGCLERPDLNIAFAVNRYSPNDNLFTQCDLRRLEFLHPSLIHAIKVVSLNAELQTYKALVETMAEAETPLVLIKEDQKVLFCNNAFKQVMPLELGHSIPQSLVEVVERESRYLRADQPLQTPEPRIAFFHLTHGQTFRMSLTHLNRPNDEADRCFLIRLHSALDSASRLNLDLQNANLTPREIEIALLVKDGFDDGEINKRLFISINTVRNHLKAIHKKLNIQSRQKLMAFLFSHQ